MGQKLATFLNSYLKRNIILKSFSLYVIDTESWATMFKTGLFSSTFLTYLIHISFYKGFTVVIICLPDNLEYKSN